MAKPITKKLIPISMKVGESIILHGFRFFLKARTMLKSLTLPNGRTTVTNRDFDEFLELSRYLKRKKPPTNPTCRERS